MKAETRHTKIHAQQPSDYVDTSRGWGSGGGMREKLEEGDGGETERERERERRRKKRREKRKKRRTGRCNCDINGVGGSQAMQL